MNGYLRRPDGQVVEGEWAALPEGDFFAYASQEPQPEWLLNYLSEQNDGG